MRIREALEAWRRVEGCTGEYLDAQVLNSAADDPLGRTHTERGVPGATWLATMAVPLLRVSGDGQRITATLWHRTSRRHVMLWPLWRRPLDLRAVQVLIEHPCLIPVSPPGPASPLLAATLSAHELATFPVHATAGLGDDGRGRAGERLGCGLAVAGRVWTGVSGCLFWPGRG